MTTLNQMTHPTHTDIQALGDKVTKASEPFTGLQESMHNVIVGQDKLLHRMFIGLLANGHLLIEGVPGLAKTLAVSSLAKGITILNNCAIEPEVKDLINFIEDL